MSSIPIVTRSSQGRTSEAQDHSVPASTPDTAAQLIPRSSWSLAALVAAPLLMVAGSAIHPAESADGAAQLAIVSEQSTRWAISHDLLALGAIIMVGAVFALGQILHTTGPRTARIGTALGVLGCGGLLGLFALEGFGAHALIGLNDPAAAGAALDRLADEAMASFAPVSLLLTLALMIMGVGLLRGRFVPVWAAAALVTGAAALMAGVVSEIGVVAATGQIVMTVAMIGIAQRVHCAPSA